MRCLVYRGLHRGDPYERGQGEAEPGGKDGPGFNQRGVHHKTDSTGERAE